MARLAREKSASGIYHAMVRGINKQPIFHMDEDRLRYLEVLAKVQEKTPFVFHAYCLMDNHIHLLLQELDEPLGDLMKRVGASYVYWFNRKYERVGHLFQARFRSEVVEDDSYFLTVLRYIHQNPVRARIVERCSDYPWSSYAAYANAVQQGKALVTPSLGLGIMGGCEALLQFVNTPNDDSCLDLDNVTPAKDGEVLCLLDKLLTGAPVSILAEMNSEQRNRVLRQVKAREGVSVRQIARLTGLGRWVIDNA